MMKYLQFLLHALVLLMCIAAERALGWPVLFFAYVFLQIRQYRGWTVYAWLLWASLLVAGIFQLSWVISWVCMVVCYFAWEYGRKVVASDTIRLFVITILGTVAVRLGAPGSFTLYGIGYGLLVLVALVVGVKRERLQPRSWRRTS